MVSLVRRLLTGSGRFPAHVRQRLEAEGLVALEEGLPGSVTYKRYRAPATRYGWRRAAITAAVALTERRIVVQPRGSTILDVPYDHPDIAALAARAEDGRLVLSYEASAFHLDRAGTVELRLRTPRAGHVAAELARRLRRAAGVG